MSRTDVASVLYMGKPSHISVAYIFICEAFSVVNVKSNRMVFKDVK